MSQFFGGALDPTWPHIVLIAGTIVGGALVGLGVILEAPKIISIPVAAVFIGGVIEAACTLLLFGFDEGISGSQQSKIIALEARLTARSLTPQQQRAIADAAAALVGALRKAGIEAALAEKTSLQVNPTRIAITIQVGIKP
jgi:hypothetical protein